MNIKLKAQNMAMLTSVSPVLPGLAAVAGTFTIFLVLSNFEIIQP